MSDQTPDLLAALRASIDRAREDRRASADKLPPRQLPNTCSCGDCYHPAFGPNTDGDPCPWCRDCGCYESEHAPGTEDGAA